MDIINVVETVNGTVLSIESFVIKDEENKAEVVQKAEELFTAKALENGAKQEDMETHIEDGYYENDGFSYVVNLVWSYPS